jgi:hypothetical protein
MIQIIGVIALLGLGDYPWQGRNVKPPWES